MLSTFEANVGLAACGAAGDAREAFEILGQGRADTCLGQMFARLRRSWGNDLAAESHLYDLCRVAEIAWSAIRFDGRLDASKACDLIAFVMERGLNMPAPAEGRVA